MKGTLSLKSCHTQRYLYAISIDSRFIKFGFASNPQSRLSGMQTGSPFEMRMLAKIAVPDEMVARGLERKIHEAAVRYHVRGEWFQSCPKTLMLVEAMKSDLADFEKLVSDWASSEWHYAKKRTGSEARSNLAFASP